MSDTTASNGQDQTAQAGGLPLVVHAQYIKDFSFENPNAPMSLQPTGKQPDVDVGVDVQARRLRDDHPRHDKE
mgnify:FL=1